MVLQDASLNVSCWSYELGCGVVLGNAQEGYQAIWGVVVGLEDVGNVGDLSSHLVSAQARNKGPSGIRVCPSMQSLSLWGLSCLEGSGLECS